METNEAYEFIGKLALALYSQKIQLKFSSLRAILADMNIHYGEGRGMAAGVRGAYHYWEKKDPLVHTAIAHTYTDRNGDISWML